MVLQGFPLLTKKAGAVEGARYDAIVLTTDAGYPQQSSTRRNIFSLAAKRAFALTARAIERSNTRLFL
jgi:hypothetical protein